MAVKQLEILASMQAELARQAAPKPQLKGSKKTSQKKNVKTSANHSKPFDRNAAFKKRDVDRDGQLTREEFLSRQGDVEAATKRFPKFDKNKDGKLSAEEYVGASGR